MLHSKITKLSTLITALLFAGLFLPQSAAAHCDSMDGPVVLAVQEALEIEDVNKVLIWVNEAQEQEVRASFQQTLEVRNENAKVRELADRYFFETVVRLHRESEGAPYTGLKPAGTDFGPAIPAADNALASRSLAEVRDLIVEKFEAELHAYFEKVMNAKDFNPDNIEAGREFVHKYVEFMHYVEPVYETVESGNATSHSH